MWQTIKDLFWGLILGLIAFGPMLLMAKFWG